MALSITETVVLGGQSRSKSIAHLATNRAPRYPLQGKWAPDEVGHRGIRRHKSPRVPDAETQTQRNAHPATRAQSRPDRATKSTVRNWIRSYRNTKYPNTPIGRTRAQSSFRPMRGLV